ncbi:MAG: hypothetical protein R3F21_04580 [Myxococcota bacterium]
MFVPDEDVVPPLGGWTTIMHALNHERVGLSPTSNLAQLRRGREPSEEDAPGEAAGSVLRRQLAELRVGSRGIARSRSATR